MARPKSRAPKRPAAVKTLPNRGRSSRLEKNGRKKGTAFNVNVSLLSTSIAERFATRKLEDAERIDDNDDTDVDEVKEIIC